MANSVEMKADVNVEFDEASSRQQINSGESVKVLFGKLRKFLTDLKAVAFSGSYADLSDKPESLPANGGNADTVNSLKTDAPNYLDIFSTTLNSSHPCWNKNVAFMVNQTTLMLKYILLMHQRLTLQYGMKWKLLVMMLEHIK